MAFGRFSLAFLTAKLVYGLRDTMNFRKQLLSLMFMQKFNQ